MYKLTSGYTVLRNSRRYLHRVSSKGAQQQPTPLPDPHVQALDEARRQGAVEVREALRSVTRAAIEAGVDPKVALELQERHGTEEALRRIEVHAGEWASSRVAFDEIADRYYEGQG